MMSSWIGRFLIKRFNFFVNRVVPTAVGRKDVLTPRVMGHYRNAQPTPDRLRKNGSGSGAEDALAAQSPHSGVFSAPGSLCPCPQSPIGA